MLASLSLIRLYFGMEYPQGYGEGAAQCLVLDGMPSMSAASDSECEAEIDADGNRLGDTNRLAVYSITAGVSIACL